MRSIDLEKKNDLIYLQSKLQSTLGIIYNSRLVAGQTLPLNNFIQCLWPPQSDTVHKIIVVFIKKFTNDSVYYGISPNV
jgi:hypothetical protein